MNTIVHYSREGVKYIIPIYFALIAVGIGGMLVGQSKTPAPAPAPTKQAAKKAAAKTFNYVPSPDHTQKNQPPQVGQAGIYEDTIGNTYPGIVVGTLGKLANGNYGVVFRMLKPNASQKAKDPSKLGDPAADEQNGWQYSPKDNIVYYCPHQPPDPNMTCP